MPLNIAIQMDPIESINIATDSSFALCSEAQKRGHNLFYYMPKDLSLYNGKLKASLQQMTLFPDKPGNHFSLGNKFFSSLTDIDIILMRQDPPFDLNYLTYTYFLEKLPKNVMVINNPLHVRNCPEKLFVTDFANLMPATLITANLKEVEEFFYEQGEIILKPLYAHGGADINKISNIGNLETIFADLLQKYNSPVIAQKFLPQVKNGDKRIILIGGKIAGAINRVPKDGEIISNTVQGGIAHKIELTKNDIKICDIIGPKLKERGLILVGIDVIGKYITEINVTSPTGLPLIDRLYDTNISAIFWDYVEESLSENNVSIRPPKKI